MKDELAKVRKAINDLPGGPLKAGLQEVMVRLGGGVTAADSGGNSPPPTPPNKP